MSTLPGYDAWKLMCPEDERNDEPPEDRDEDLRDYEDEH